MAVPASSPLPIVLVAPPAADAPAPHGLIGGGRILSELLCSEVAACVAAVGHRLHVIPRSPGWAREALAVAVEPPVPLLWGLAPGESQLPEPSSGPAGPPGLPDVPVLPVTLGPVAPSAATGPRGALGLPAASRQLCRALARAAPAGAADPVSPRAAVVVHEGDGPDGDARWPGLSWALTLLWGGPGRGVLMDAQGPGGSLSARLRALAPPAPGRLGWQSPGAVPVPGPALMARLPSAGGVRWWGWEARTARSARAARAAPGGHPQEQPSLWPARQACVQAASEAAAWTVVDVGRDLDQAQEAAAGGLPVVLCTDRAQPTGLAIHPDVVLRTNGAVESVPFRAADWAGASWAAWDRSARRGSGRRLAAEIGLRLEQVTASGPGGVLAGRMHP